MERQRSRRSHTLALIWAARKTSTTFALRLRKMKMRLVKASGTGDWFPSSETAIEPTRRRCLDVKGYYSLLGVDASATQDEIKSAAKSIMLEKHPDLGGDQDEFIRVMDAYKTLSDPVSRALYDAEQATGSYVRVAVVETPTSANVTDKPCFYKDMRAILSDEMLKCVYGWMDMVKSALSLFHVGIEVKVGIGKRWSLEDGLAVMQEGEMPDYGMAMAYALVKLIEKQKKTN